MDLEGAAGRLSSGSDDPSFSAFSPALRPSALYLGTNIRSSTGATYNAGVPRGGYVTLDLEPQFLAVAVPSFRAR